MPLKYPLYALLWYHLLKYKLWISVINIYVSLKRWVNQVLRYFNLLLWYKDGRYTWWKTTPTSEISSVTIQIFFIWVLRYRIVCFKTCRLKRKLLTAAGVSVCTERVSRFTVTAIATVCIHAALGTWSLQETALIHIWSQYETLFKLQKGILVANDAGEHR